ncbi:MAG: pyridoxamine kinase [Megasphaera sp.]|uniref:pyridoxamine kinase n=1 Tax=Megasphaera sp. TaxID=2023260 RepID=UPI0025C6E7BE|nr:pyridoxamine kinase [Megasphaera sp.]MCF0152856.1 pyridoxamine kinase [Megasphaera sp.]MCI7599981.1 pyridoxamine kinase [Megasphaera sp.]
MATKRVLAIHDMCSFGRCSLTAAIPVISAMGFQVCPFPTALFSNNLTYGDYTFSDFTPHMTEFMDKWQQLGYSYDAIYSGFLADAGQIAIVLDAISRFAKKDTLVVVDPAMADDGKLYPVFKPDIVTEMHKLIAKAAVITPNYTEASLLTGRPYDQTIPSMKALLELCQQLAAMGPKDIVITSVPSANDTIKVVSYDSQTATFDECTVDRIPFSTCGTGDLFTSVLTGSLLQGQNLHDSVKKAVKFLSYAINYTYQAGSDYREGVQVEPCLKKLF